MPSVLQKIKPLHPEKVPPAGSVPVGLTPDGKQLYRLKRMRSKGVPRIDPETGERMMRKHAITGEPMYGLNEPKVFEENLLFFLESEGNGNIRMQLYTPPTEEQVAAEERTKNIEAMKGHLAEVLVDRGVTPEQLLAGVTPEKFTALDLVEPVPPPEPGTEPDTEPGTEYPKALGGGWWGLSDGEKVQVKESDAIELEAVLAKERKRAHEDAAQTPEV